MTVMECDSTTYTESSLQDGSHHAYGCTRKGSPCSSSLLRLALIAGSAYAVRYTTCAVNVRPSRSCVEWRKRTHPYQKKNEHSEPVSRSSSPNDENGPHVSSRMDLSFKNDKRIDSTIENHVSDDFQRDLSIRHHSDVTWKPVESSRTSLKPLEVTSEAEDQRFAEE